MSPCISLSRGKLSKCTMFSWNVKQPLKVVESWTLHGSVHHVDKTVQFDGCDFIRVWS
jgi:hypothetical protein